MHMVLVTTRFLQAHRVMATAVRNFQELLWQDRLVLNGTQRLVSYLPLPVAWAEYLLHGRIKWQKFIMQSHFFQRDDNSFHFFSALVSPMFTDCLILVNSNAHHPVGHQQADPGQAAWNQQYYGQQGQQQPGYQQGAYPTQYQQPAAQPQPQPAQTNTAPTVNPQTGM